MPKEEDLCRACAMIADLPGLLRRAIEEYKKTDLTEHNLELIYEAEDYQQELAEVEIDYSTLLNKLYELAGLDILDIGYD